MKKNNLLLSMFVLLFTLNCKQQTLHNQLLNTQQESQKVNKDERVYLTHGYSTHTKYYLDGKIEGFVLIDSLERVVLRVFYNEDGSVDSNKFDGITWYGFNKDYENNIIEFKTIIPPNFDETMTYDYYEIENYENGLKPEVAYRDSITKTFTFSLPQKGEEAAFQIILKNQVDSLVLYQSFKVRKDNVSQLSVE